MNWQELEKQLFETLKRDLQFENLHDELFRVDEKMMKYLEVKARLGKLRITAEKEFRERRAELTRKYKFDSALPLKNTEIEKLLFEDERLLQLAETIEYAKLYLSLIDTIISMMQRRAFALNTAIKKEVANGY